MNKFIKMTLLCSSVFAASMSFQTTRAFAQETGAVVTAPEGAQPVYDKSVATQLVTAIGHLYEMSISTKESSSTLVKIEETAKDSNKQIVTAVTGPRTAILQSDIAVPQGTMGLAYQTCNSH